MAKKLLSQAELDSVAGMPSRLAAEKLGVGKSTVNDARNAARDNGGRLPAPDGVVEVSGKVPTTKAEIDAELIARGWSPDEYTFHYGFSIFDQGDQVKHALKGTAVPKKGVAEVTVAETVDPFAVLAELRALPYERYVAPRGKAGGVEEESFCLSINDLQLGQSFNGGSAFTIAQFHLFVELAVKRIAELRLLGRNLTTLTIVFGGDLVEGCTIYPNMAYSLDMDRKTQIEGVIALGLYALDTLAPLFEHVKVLACKGNHGEHRINGNYTTLYDNDDTHTVDMMRLALSRDPNMAHIEWVIAGTEAAVAINVFDWVLATTHGDIYAKHVGGATIDRKAQQWYKNMAASGGRFGLVGRADVLIGHHFHHDKMSNWGKCYWRQTPSQDRGSEYFEQSTGEYSEPGMLTWVMSESVRYKDEQVLRR